MAFGRTQMYIGRKEKAMIEEVKQIEKYYPRTYTFIDSFYKNRRDEIFNKINKLARKYRENDKKRIVELIVESGRTDLAYALIDNNYSFSHVNLYYYFKKDLFRYAKISNDISKVLLFDNQVLTDKFIKKNMSKILNEIRSKNTIFESIDRNQIIFDELIKSGTVEDYRLASLFDETCFKKNSNVSYEENIRKNYEYICSKLKQENHFRRLHFYDSECLFEELLKNNEFDLMLRFSFSILNMDKYYNVVYSILQEKGGIPKEHIYDAGLFYTLVHRREYDLVDQFDTSLLGKLDSKSLLDYIGDNEQRCLNAVKRNHVFEDELIREKKYKYLLMLPSVYYKKFMDSEFIDRYYNEIIEYIKNNEEHLSKFKDISEFKDKLIENGEYKYLLMLPFSSDILFNDKMINIYCKELGITKDIFIKKINNLLNVNDEVLETLIPLMLQPKFDNISFNMMEQVALYSDIQYKLSEIDGEELYVFFQIINSIEKVNKANDNSLDISTVIYHVIQHWDQHKNLIASINKEKLNDQEILNLIFILKKDGNFFEIDDRGDLRENVFNRKKENIFMKIENSLSPDIKQFQSLLLEKYFGIDYSMGEFINKRYCSDLELLKRSNIDIHLKRILFDINDILTIDSIDELRSRNFSMQNLKIDINMVYTDLEAVIRGEYAKMFSNKLVKLDENIISDDTLHQLQEKDFSNSSLFEKLNKITYKDINRKLSNSEKKFIKPKFYVVDGDFNMLIHVLGAYSSYSRPDDFKEDWLRPKIASHGICTSFIGNNQIANARQFHPSYGFSQLEGDSLLLAGNYDLVSKRVIFNFASSIVEPYNFLPPKEMIDSTRHTHNEVVIERRASVKNDSFKRVPDYVVYFVDDINNEEMFSTDNNLFCETVQAAIDNNIPIVIIDRKKFALRERNKCDNLKKQFEQTLDFEILRELFLTICNNMVGCQKYKGQDDMEYHHIFDDKYLDSVLEEEIRFISNQNEIICKELFDKLRDYVHKEKFIDNNEFEKIVDKYKQKQKIIISNDTQDVKINEQDYQISGGRGR